MRAFPSIGVCVHIHRFREGSPTSITHADCHQPPEAEHLVTESAAAGASESHATTFEVLQSTIAELTTEPRASLLRMLAAAIHSDEAIAQQFHTRLFQPQQEQITRLVAADATPTQRRPPSYSWHPSSIDGSSDCLSSPTASCATTWRKCDALSSCLQPTCPVSTPRSMRPVTTRSVPTRTARLF